MKIFILVVALVLLWAGATGQYKNVYTILSGKVYPTGASMPSLMDNVFGRIKVSGGGGGGSSGFG